MLCCFRRNGYFVLVGRLANTRGHPTCLPEARMNAVVYTPVQEGHAFLDTEPVHMNVERVTPIALPKTGKDCLSLSIGSDVLTDSLRPQIRSACAIEDGR